MKKKKVLALVLASASIVTMLSGFSFKPAAVKAAAATKYATHLKIKVAFWNNPSYIDMSKSDAIRSYFYKKFNMEINPVNITWSDYKTQLNTWAASDTLPDVFADDAVQENTFAKWITQGVVKQLPTNLSAYPNLKKYLSDPSMENYKYPFASKNGKFYCIPRKTLLSSDQTCMNFGILLRKDWMAKVGVKKMPTNMTEFTSLMKKFVNNDPDGDKKKDTIGCTCYDASWLYAFFLSSEPSVQGWKLSGSKWIPGFTTTSAAKGAQQLQNLYKAGGLDADFASLTGTQGWDKFTTGVAGAYCHSVDPGTLESLYKDMEKKYGNGFDWDKKVVIMKPFKAFDGNLYRNVDNIAWSETYFSSHCSDDKMKRMLALYDWANGTEGWTMLHWGIKNVDYKVAKDGTKTAITKKDSAGKQVDASTKYKTFAYPFFYWSGVFSFENPTVNPEIRKDCNNMVAWYKKNTKPVQCNLKSSFVTYPSKAKATFLLKDEIIKAIMSSNATTEWNSMVVNYKKNGYNTVIADYNAACKKLGITGYTKF